MKNPFRTTDVLAFFDTLMRLALACCWMAGWRCVARDLVVNGRVVDGWVVELTWQGASGRLYHIECKTNLDDAAWQLVPGEIEGCDYMVSTNWVICTNVPSRFFRVLDYSYISPQVGFCSSSNDCVLCHQFFIGRVPEFTNDFMVTASGFLLRSVYTVAQVCDGPATGSPITDYQMVYADLLNDPRVAYAYPGRTDATLQTTTFYFDLLQIKLRAPFTNISAVLTDYHLGFDSYLSYSDVYLARVLRKSDDPYYIVQAAQADPRVASMSLVPYLRSVGNTCIWGP